MRLERRFSSSFMGVLGVFKASLQPDQLQVCWTSRPNRRDDPSRGKWELETDPPQVRSGQVRSGLLLGRSLGP